MNIKVFLIKWHGTVNLIQKNDQLNKRRTVNM